MDDQSNMPTAPQGQSVVELYYAGNKDAANRLLQRQNAQPAEPSDVALDEGEAAPMLDANIAMQAAEAMSTEVHGGEQLISEWGGVGSAEFDENIQILRDFQENATPEIRQLAQSWVTLPDGTEAQLGNTAAAIRYVLDNVKANRSMRHNPEPRNFNRSIPSGRGSADAQLEALTEALHEARMDGNTAAVRRLDAQRRALADRVWGGGNIVGRGGRYA